MPEVRALSLFRWGEELRRRRIERRSGRIQVAAAVVAGAAAAALVGTMIRPPEPRLVWNGSASSPVGLYRVSAAATVAAGGMVIAWPPAAARRLAAERRYLPANVPLVKHVAAAPGDRVCAVGEALFVNGRFVARRRREDPMGRSLPWWSGCHELEEDELLLLMPGAPDSFDGRYFGVTKRRHVLGSARLLWAG